MKVYGHLDHYNYDIVDKLCECNICNQWRKFAQLNSTQIYNKDEKKHIVSMYAVISTKRELYCEMSWHGNKFPWGKDLMVWISSVIFDKQLTFTWWKNCASTLSLEYWFDKYRKFTINNTIDIEPFRRTNEYIRWESEYISFYEKGGNSQKSQEVGNLISQKGYS